MPKSKAFLLRDLKREALLGVLHHFFFDVEAVQLLDPAGNLGGFKISTLTAYVMKRKLKRKRSSVLTEPQEE